MQEFSLHEMKIAFVYLAACSTPKWPDQVRFSGSQSTVPPLCSSLAWGKQKLQTYSILPTTYTVYLLTYHLASSQPLIVFFLRGLLGIGRKISQGEHVVHSSHISYFKSTLKLHEQSFMKSNLVLISYMLQTNKKASTKR